MTRKEIAIALVKEKKSRQYLYYCISDLIASILWLFGQDHLALGMVIMSVAWAWTAATIIRD
jgi:hypothetical protein